MRILTFNVQNDEGDPRRTRLIARELRRLAPDVVVLQEVCFPGQLAQLLAGTGLAATHQQQVLPGSPDEYGGTAVATRWPHRGRRQRERRALSLVDAHRRHLERPADRRTDHALATGSGRRAGG